MNLVLMGLPGAGKGTQAEQLLMIMGSLISQQEICSAICYERGDTTWAQAKSFIDKGELVPDEVTIGIVREKDLAKMIVNKVFFWTDFPRTVAQAEALEDILKDLGRTIDYVINIKSR
ncbi:nucleoside monophosphate kinase [Bacillus sp. SL00103]